MPGEDQRLEIAMGRMLRIGVTGAALIVLSGGVLYVGRFPGAVPNYQHFHGASTGFGNLSTILAGISHFDGGSMISLGILVLIATPICRVIFGVIGFSLLRDRLYAAVSAIVLIILLLSFFTRR